MPQQEIDDLMGMFSRMGVAAQVNAVDDLARALGGLGFGGSRKKTRRVSRSKRKTSRRLRRH